MSARRGSAFGFFGLFGRSSDLRQLDKALRDVDVHPVLVPDGVKLAIVNIMKDAVGGEYPPAAHYPPTAALLGYCMLGAEPFTSIAGHDAAVAVEERIERAIDAGSDATDSDAALLLLLLHARLIQPSVVADYDLAAASEE